MSIYAYIEDEPGKRRYFYPDERGNFTFSSEDQGKEVTFVEATAPKYPTITAEQLALIGNEWNPRTRDEANRRDEWFASKINAEIRRQYDENREEFLRRFNNLDLESLI